MLSDYHLHCKFSSDSEEEPENVVKKALELGMKSICFTDHMDYGYPVPKDDPSLTFCLDIPKYTEEIAVLREKYADTIRIYTGIELGVMPHIGNKNREIISSYPFDYVIASTHLIDGTDPYYADFWLGRDVKDILFLYFEQTLRSIEEFDDFDCLGHLDYMTRYVPDKSFIFNPADFSDITDKILKTLIAMGKGIEINTAGYRYNMGRPNPGAEIIKRYKKLGGKIITVGSDAHKAQDVGSDFSNAERILKKCGFDSYYTFKGRKPVKHVL